MVSAPGLPDDVDRVLTAILLAVQKHSMYPAGHPALDSAVTGALTALESFLGRRDRLAIGVASRQLTVDDAVSDPGQPRLSGLAGRFHRHQLASISFLTGVTKEEVAEFLALVSTEAELAERPLGAGIQAEHPAWPHLRLEPIRYDRFGLAEDPQTGAEAGTGRSSELWLGLARAALSGQTRGASAARESEATGEPDARMMAHALVQFSGDDVYASEVFAHLVEISEELRFAGDGAAEMLGRRTGEVLALAEPDALRRVLAGGGDSASRHRLLLGASRWLDPEAALKLLRATAEVEDRDLSHWLLLLLAKMAKHSGSDSFVTRTEASHHLRGQIERLAADWALDDVTAPEYSEMLGSMSARTSSSTGTGHVSVEPDRVLSMRIEIDELGVPAREVVREYVRGASLARLLETLGRAPEGSAAADELWREIESADTIHDLLADESPDFEALDLVIERMGAAAAEPLLDGLSETGSRYVRRQLFTRLARMAESIVPLIMARLEDPRWYVIRNMLALMGRLEKWPSGWSPVPFATHAHPHARREALKLMLAAEEHRATAIARLLEDDDSRSVSLGLAAAQAAAPADAIPLLARFSENEAHRDELRVLAVRALGHSGSDGAISALVRIAEGKRTWLVKLLSRPLLGWLPGLRWVGDASAPRLASLEELARLEATDADARRVLAQAERSADPRVRVAATGRVGA